ncbi:MAG: phytoene desaturase family protein [Chloroflexota bacterium]|nr:phytoene desaturase family protein [Chloroflexota bacterium]
MSGVCDVSAGRRVLVVGAGFAGLAAAALLARDGWQVQVLEKNREVGGCARVWHSGGFSFDMGPTLYLMPEVFERYFALFGCQREDFYSLRLLDPSYRVFFGGDETVDVTPDLGATLETFEGFEPGGAQKLQAYLDRAAYQYDIIMREFLYRDRRSIVDFVNRRVLIDGTRLNILKSLDGHVSSYFSDHRAKKLLEYSMVFLGSSPWNARALYAIMSHVDIKLGVWYPHGGMGSVVAGLQRLAESHGVAIRTGEPVRRLEARDGRVERVVTDRGEYTADVVLVGADYAHAETELLAPPYQSYPASYWRKRVIAPSMFMVYLGLTKKVDALCHHNLYFAHQWQEHFASIFDRPAWPQHPSYYVHCPSRTDDAVAPWGHENVLISVPVAPGLDDGDGRREQFADQVLAHLEGLVGERIRDSIAVKRIYSHRDFKRDYHAYGGTAMGLAHTLSQTALFRPSHRSRKARNLFYTGQYTHPGIGVPMAFIAAEIVAEEVSRQWS